MFVDININNKITYNFKYLTNLLVVRILDIWLWTLGIYTNTIHIDAYVPCVLDGYNKLCMPIGNKVILSLGTFFCRYCSMRLYWELAIIIPDLSSMVYGRGHEAQSFNVDSFINCGPLHYLLPSELWNVVIHTIYVQQIVETKT